MEQQTEFIPYEQALELKELGFDEVCLGYYDTEGLKVSSDWYLNPHNKNSLFLESHITNNPKISAPLYQQSFRWFREKYKLIFHIECDYNIFLGYIHGYIPIYSLYPYSGDCYKTYEEAELACLNKLIEIVKNK